MTGNNVRGQAAGGSCDPASIVLRRVDIDFDLPAGQPWFPSEVLVEWLLSAFSFMLPPGERFFIASVREHADRISDPLLKEQVRRFIHQEAMHSRQHDAANRRLEQQYKRGAWIGPMTRRHLAFWGLLLGQSARLGQTCAIEHFTATAARSLLQHQDHCESVMDPAFYRLWMWHAVEESEHKSVCFDVYRTCVGTGMSAYLIRIFTYALITVTFLLTLAVAMVLLGRPPRARAQHQAPVEQRQRGVGALVPMILPWRQYLAYFRPSFHPSDFDCASDIEKWKARFPDFDGRPARPAAGNPAQSAEA